MKTFAFLVLTCSMVASGQQVTIERIQLSQTMINGVDTLAITAEVRNDGHAPITVRDADFALVTQRGDIYESDPGPFDTDGANFIWGERINPGVTADHIVFIKVPSTIDLRDSIKLLLGQHKMNLYGPVEDYRPNPTNAVQRYNAGEPTQAPPPATQTGAPALFHVGNGVSAPQLISAPEAAYPDQARREIEGTCVVSLIVERDGTAQRVTVVRPIGHGLDETAVAAVKQYRFRPALMNGAPVPVEVNVEVHFRNH
jgi:TonB family protein